MAKLTPAFAYIRMSTDEQENSPEQQRREIIQYAKARGYRITRWYEDLGISGDRTDKRVGFQRMINDAAGGGADAILCWDQDRFGRFDMIEAGYWIEPLRKAGVFLDTCTDGVVDWSDMASRLTYSVKQEAKHDLCKSISRNVTRVFEQYAKDGKWAAAAPPYGYVIGPDRRLHKAAPDVVANVRSIFQRYADGYTPRAIVNWLRESGIDSPRGRGWTTQQIREIIANERYLGRAIYNQRSKSKYKKGSGRTGKRRKLDRSEWTIVENCASRNRHPEIV